MDFGLIFVYVVSHSLAVLEGRFAMNARLLLLNSRVIFNCRSCSG